MIILHGEDANKSYERLIFLTEEIRSKEIDVVIQDAVDLDITYLRQEISSSGLFGSCKCFVIKNLLSGSKSKNTENLIQVLNQQTDHEIILWENKGLSATALKKFKNSKVELFPISPIIFKFLDLLKPHNTDNILRSWKNIINEGTAPEFVHAMLVRQLKLLIQAKSGPSYLRIAPYPAKLVTNQATYFTQDHLLDLYQYLYDIDLKIKTGKGGNSMENLLTNFLQKI